MNSEPPRLRHSQAGFSGVPEVLLVIIVLSVIGFAVWRITISDDLSQSQAKFDSVDVISALPQELSQIHGIEDIKQLMPASEVKGASIIGFEITTSDGVTAVEAHLSDGRTGRWDSQSETWTYNTWATSGSQNIIVPKGLDERISTEEVLSLASTHNQSGVVRINYGVFGGSPGYVIGYSDGSVVRLNAQGDIDHDSTNNLGSDWRDFWWLVDDCDDPNVGDSWDPAKVDCLNIDDDTTDPGTSTDTDQTQHSSQSSGSHSGEQSDGSNTTGPSNQEDGTPENGSGTDGDDSDSDNGDDSENNGNDGNDGSDDGDAGLGTQ